MIWEIIVGTEDPSLAVRNQTVGEIIYSIFIYAVCAFLVFLFHDFVQRAKAKRYHLEISGSIIKSLVKDPYNWFSVAVLVFFGVAFKRRTELPKTVGRKQDFMISLCGILSDLGLGVVSFVLLQVVYILRDDVGVGFFDVFIPWLNALFSTCVLVCVFSVILCVVPNDGGHLLASVAPFETRDKLLAVPSCVSFFIVIVLSLIFAKTYFSNSVIGDVWNIFSSVWTKIGEIFIN